MRALGLALIVAILLPLLPAAAVFAATTDAQTSLSPPLAETEPQPTPTADATPTPEPTPTPDASAPPASDPTAAPDPTTTPDPSATPDPTASAGSDIPAAPDPTPTPPADLGGDGVTPAADPTPAADATPAPDPTPPPPTLAVLKPAPGSTIYVRTDDAPSLSWAESPDVDVRSRVVSEETGQADSNGTCDAIDVVATWTRDDASSPMAVGQLLAGRCYRYTVQLRLRGGDSVAVVSGWFRVLPRWTGAYNLYRAGVFSTQRKSSWCVAASIQMMKNVVLGQSDQSYANQETYMRSARSLDMYTAGDGAKGTDPAGWAAALRVHGAGTNYRVLEKSTFNAAVRAAARALRRTGKPVGLLVGHGSHAWVMTGFKATADPGMTSDYRVTHVYIMGPLYPRPKHDGFDPAPNKRIDVDTLRSRFLTRYHDRLGPSRWDGSYVVILP
jgi:hypothetical protein